MKISVLGSGMVGQAIAGKLSELGHEVFMGTRDPEKTRARSEPDRVTGLAFGDWLAKFPGIKLVALGQLPGDSELFINATGGRASSEALNLVGSGKLAGKTILDIANPLDFSGGMPPTLSVCNTDSLAEQLQREFPESHFVKSLNTMNALIMVNPSLIPGEHQVFLSGNDASAKERVRSLLNEFGWTGRMILDLGGLSTARGTEMLLPAWIRIMGSLGSAEFNFHIARK